MSFNWANDPRAEAIRDDIKRMWTEDGFSVTNISTLIETHHGVKLSRSAVIGKLHRMGLAGDDKPVQRRQVKPHHTDMRKHLREIRLRKKSPFPVPDNAPTPVGPLNDIPEVGCCRYIAGDPDPKDFQFQMCGNKTTAPSDPWCAYHRHLCYSGGTPTRQLYVKRPGLFGSVT